MRKVLMPVWSAAADPVTRPRADQPSTYVNGEGALSIRSELRSATAFRIACWREVNGWELRHQKSVIAVDTTWCLAASCSRRFV